MRPTGKASLCISVLAKQQSCSALVVVERHTGLSTVVLCQVPCCCRGMSTTVRVLEDTEGSHSELFVDTPDRPGLLTAIVSTLKDVNVNVISAEVDTEGDQAKDMFYVTYHGDPLPPPMVQLVTNALQYYLTLSEVEKEESY